MILSRQRAVRVALRPLERFLSRVKRELGLVRAVISICLVSDAEIAKMNQAFRKKKGPTDVLSFPTEARTRPMRIRRHRAGRKSRSTTTEFLGDIAISPEAARRNATLLGRSLLDEMRVLILHGVLHLLGYDHETDRGEMDRVEALLRAKLRLM
jgi:probable rRNA maturation factor